MRQIATRARAGLMGPAHVKKLDDPHVTSINGMTGAVSLTASDVGAAAASHTHSNATTSASGFMSATDKSKLDGIEAGAQVNAVTSVAGKTGAVTLSASDISGLGNAATRDVGTTSGTVAAGDDSRITGALQRSGGTMTGALTLSGDPTSNLHAATKGYADDNFVSFSQAQTLTPEQQEQARANIGVQNKPSRAHITHIRDNPAFPGVVYDRIVISGGVGSLQMVTGKDLQPDGSIVPEEAKLSARRNGSRVVVNASAFFNRGDDFYLPAGLYIHDGVPYQEFSPTEERAQEAIVMYRDGVLRPARISDGKTAAQYVAEGALWSTGWGPLLVVDGVKTTLTSSAFNTQLSARTILGQRANGDYVIILVEGKSGDYGVTLFQAQDICLSEGLVIAMNLDGGGTTQCWWDTAYAHPSSDDTPRRVGNYLTANVAQLNPFDTGLVTLPLETGVTATGANVGGVRLRQINDEVSIQVSVNVSPNMTTDAYRLLTSGVPKRFWPENGVLVRGMLSGASYRLVSLGMPHPLTGQLYARPQQAEEAACSGTVFYKAKWSA